MAIEHTERSAKVRALTDLPMGGDDGAEVNERGGDGNSIGFILKGSRRLSDQQIEQVLNYQQHRRLPFGEAAVALKLVSRDDVLWALAQQFQYAYAPSHSGRLKRELAMAVNPFGNQAEAFRELRSQLLMGILAPDQPRRALAVVSPQRGDGKTFIASNLAVAFSQLGGHTLLIDADMRTPRQHKVFSLDGRGGLSNILSGRAESNVIHSIPDLPGLFVLPAGIVPPNPLELLERSAFKMLVQELLTRFDHVIVDTAATAHGPDAKVVAARAGAAMVIGRRGHSRMADIDHLLAALSGGPATLAGVVLNDR